MSIGIKVCLTGVVLFAFFSFLAKVARQHPVTPGYDVFCGIAVIGLFMIPAGLLVAIWLHL